MYSPWEKVLCFEVVGVPAQSRPHLIERSAKPVLLLPVQEIILDKHCRPERLKCALVEGEDVIDSERATDPSSGQ